MSNYATSPFERAIATSDREFRELADFAPVMIWRSGVDKLCDWFNKPWLDYTGRSMEDEVGNGWAECVHPEDLDRCLTVYTSAFDAREPFSMEYRLRRRDGEYLWMLDNGAPFHRDGHFAGYWGSCIDVTAHRDAQRAQRIIINELNHRVKNSLAVVHAMAIQSFRGERPVEQSLALFESRLRALAGAHDLLVARAWEDVALRGVVEATVSPHDPEGNLVRMDGPALMLRAEPAVSIAMMLHELLTNAIKYGALSVAGGTVSLQWAYVPERRAVRLEWKESGGPHVEPPGQLGFGTRFIERVLAAQAGGTAKVTFAPDGVHCVFVAEARTGPGKAWCDTPVVDPLDRLADA